MTDVDEKIKQQEIAADKAAKAAEKKAAAEAAAAEKAAQEQADREAAEAAAAEQAAKEQADREAAALALSMAKEETAKDKLYKQGEAILEDYPEANEVYMCVNGFGFFSLEDARNHAATLSSAELLTIKRK